MATRDTYCIWFKDVKVTCTFRTARFFNLAFAKGMRCEDLTAIERNDD